MAIYPQHGTVTGKQLYCFVLCSIVPFWLRSFSMAGIQAGNKRIKATQTNMEEIERDKDGVISETVEGP